MHFFAFNLAKQSGEAAGGTRRGLDGGEEALIFEQGVNFLWLVEWFFIFQLQYVIRSWLTWKCSSKWKLTKFRKTATALDCSKKRLYPTQQDLRCTFFKLLSLPTYYYLSESPCNGEADKQPGSAQLPQRWWGRCWKLV